MSEDVDVIARRLRAHVASGVPMQMDPVWCRLLIRYIDLGHNRLELANEKIEHAQTIHEERLAQIREAAEEGYSQKLIWILSANVAILIVLVGALLTMARP